MVSASKDPSQGPLPIPTSRISRLFRPYLTKLASLESLFSSAPSFVAPIATRSMRTYSKADQASQYTGLAKGLPVFEQGKRMKRATARAIPKELLPVPPPLDLKRRLKEKAPPGSKLPQLPHVEMVELSKRVYAVVQAFNNILDVVYPTVSTSSAAAGPLGIEALGAMCARRVGENVEVWIDAQLEDEFAYMQGSDDELSRNAEGRRMELRDDWWEGVPEHWRRFAVPVHALTIAIGMNLPMHGLYEALLDACIARSAVYEVALLLPHMIHHAYTLKTSVKASPGPSYLPTLSRKVSTTSPALGSRWQTTVNKAATSVHVWLDWAAGEDAGQEQVERRWLGDAMDGLVRESRDAAGAALFAEVVRTMIDHPARETMSELLVQRLSTWSQYTIFLSNTLRLRDSCSEVVAAIDASLNELADLLHEQLTPIDRQPIATALLALDLHSLWTQSLVAPTENSTPATPPRLPRDTLQFCFLPHILSSHVTISTVLSLATTLRMVGTLPTIESGLLQCAIAEYDRLSPFADSTILSPEEQQMASIGLEELSDLATDAEKRRLAVDIGDGGTPGGTAKGMRWEEMVGAWIEATPQGRPTKVAKRRVVLSPLTDYETSDDDDREEQSDEGEESDDPMDALDGSSGDEREIVVRKEVRGLKRMGRMSLDGPSSIASEDEDEDDHALEEEVLQQVTSVGDSESDEDTHSDAPVVDNFVRDDSTAPSSSSTARPSSSPPPPPTRTRQPIKRPRNSPLPPPITSATRFPPIPPQPLFISSNPKLNATLPAARDRRLSQLILTRPPHPQARRTHTSLPDPDTAGASTPVRSGKAPPAWLHSRFSPAAGSPLRRISGGPGTACQQRSTQRLHHPTAASSLVPHSPSPLQSTPHGASRMNAAQAFSRHALTSAHKWTYPSPHHPETTIMSSNASATAPTVDLLASSSPSKLGSPSPVRKKLRLRSKATAANQLPPSSDPVPDSLSEGEEKEEVAEEEEEEMAEVEERDEEEAMEEERDEQSAAPPSSEADDMDLFAASSPVLPVKTMRRRSRGVLKMAGSGRGTTGGGAGGMREKLGRKRVGWGLTREEV